MKTKHALVGLALAGLFALAGLPGCGSQADTLPTESNSDATSPRNSDEKREMTYITAKQAFARLSLHLAKQGAPTIKNLRSVIPERTATYLFGEDRLAGLVGGWVFDYEDESSHYHQARVTCWGEVKVESAPRTSSRWTAAINPGDWVLDNTDARTVALSNHAISNHDNLGGWLMTCSVMGLGQRAVWCGGAWRTADGSHVLAVDARSGEIYRSSGAEPRFERIGATPIGRGDDWDGGFDPKSTAALLGRSDHPYWWPLCYQSPGRQHYLYNRPLLRQKIEAERKLPSRTASSWQATGVASAALGDWGAAARDLMRAVELDPDNHQVRFQRGLILSALRDFDQAASDLRAGDEREAQGALEHLEVLTGSRPREGLSAFMYNLETDFGMIPIQFQVGPLLLTQD